MDSVDVRNYFNRILLFMTTTLFLVGLNGTIFYKISPEGTIRLISEPIILILSIGFFAIYVVSYSIKYFILLKKTFERICLGDLNKYFFHDNLGESINLFSFVFLFNFLMFIISETNLISKILLGLIIVNVATIISLCVSFFSVDDDRKTGYINNNSYNNITMGSLLVSIFGSIIVSAGNSIVLFETITRNGYNFGFIFATTIKNLLNQTSDPTSYFKIFLYGSSIIGFCFSLILFIYIVTNVYDKKNGLINVNKFLHKYYEFTLGTIIAGCILSHYIKCGNTPGLECLSNNICYYYYSYMYLMTFTTIIFSFVFICI